MILTELIEDVKRIALQAGEFIAEERLKFDQSAVEYKYVNNVVSYVDKEAEVLIVRELSAILPEAGFITEEDTVTDNKETTLKWIIDPLDGTANFIHGLPHYSVSIALVDGNEPLLGVVYHICTKDIFWATRGGGTFKNTEQVFVSKTKTLGESLLATGFPYYKFEEQDKYLQILEALMQKTHGLRRFGSAALDLAYVACGYYDGFFEFNLNSWDMAAGILLITEAGGQVSDFSGGQNHLFGGDIVAGNEAHAPLLEEIKKYW